MIMRRRNTLYSACAVIGAVLDPPSRACCPRRGRDAGQHARWPTSAVTQRRWPGTADHRRGSCAAWHRGSCAPWPHATLHATPIVRIFYIWVRQNRAAGRWRNGDEQPPGARRGASKRQYRATTGDVERLRLLVEPHPTTSGYWLDLYLYGMQRVRSSNLRSSTSFPGENPTSSLPRQPSRSPDRHLTVVLGGMSEHRAP